MDPDRAALGRQAVFSEMAQMPRRRDDTATAPAGGGGRAPGRPADGYGTASSRMFFGSFRLWQYQSVLPLVAATVCSYVLPAAVAPCS